MKKLLLLLGAATALSASAANPIVLDSQYNRFIPGQFTSSKSSMLSAETDFGYRVYNDKLEKVADLIIPAPQTVTYTYYSKWSSEPAQEITKTEPLSELVDIEFESEKIQDGYFPLSQTLFNNDSKFEYVLLNYEIVEISEENAITAWGNKEWGEILAMKGYTIMSEDGSKVLEINLPDGYYVASTKYSISVYQLGNYFYIAISATNVPTGSDGEQYTFYYPFDSASGVKAPTMVKGRMKVSPAAPRHGETVSVDLGEVAESATAVNIVSANGSIVQSLPVAKGEQQVSVSTAGLASGLYIVTANGREAAKIIIR